MSETRTKILDVADDLVQRIGLNAMSYKHISDAVGIRKASIHHHFSKKEDLVNALLERCAISYGDRYQQIVEIVQGHKDVFLCSTYLCPHQKDAPKTQKTCVPSEIRPSRNCVLT